MNRQIWQILSLKYDNRPHYTWPAALISDDGDRIRLRSNAGFMLTHYTRGFKEPMRFHSALNFWRDRWYNVFINYYADGNLRNYYCNVTMPLTLSENTLSFVDLDLDVSIRPDGAISVLDEDEFELHRVQLNYPDWVQQKAREAVDDLIAMAKRREEPFNRLK